MDALRQSTFNNVPNLVYVSDDKPGWTRRRCGRGFSYFREDGSRIRDKLIRDRLKALAIPPAWREVWICPLENGHLLSTGRDDADRKQYRYHPDWMAYQQLNKFSQLVGFAELLPAARQGIRTIITDRSQQWSHRRVSAIAVALLDETGMRVGNASYQRKNGTTGLTTLRRKHVETDEDGLHFDYTGKSNIERSVDLADKTLVRLVHNMSELPGYKIFRYRDADGKMKDLDSRDVNEMIKELVGPDFSSKFFRTWAATSSAVREYWELREENGGKVPERPDLRVTERVAEFLGNTVSVCRKYYIHPAVMAAIIDGNVPGPESVSSKDEERFSGEFDLEEIIAFSLCSAK
ncbi:DNA topoisomerase IB [Neolewinella aurantiaca]|uniref:DNA topoisomerase n=1 Tax=Neolewinella aurantiaca TaxID=2602767 RepID=A0A5C7G017_9BACT|nr:DNA topoisomerase IB [Neolewinella aurantiaca]TXF91390.1 DNA topoisomerase IB [Neolewinella aurantiaca]